MTVRNTTLEHMIDKQKTAYLGSVDGEGYPNVKAMLAPRKREGLKTFYLTTNTSSKRVADFIKNPKACLYFADTRFFRGLMLVGTVEVMTDAETKRSVWKIGDTMYYPLGVTDPDYCVLKFTAESGRFYQNFSTASVEIPE